MTKITETPEFKYEKGLIVSALQRLFSDYGYNDIEVVYTENGEFLDGVKVNDVFFDFCDGNLLNDTIQEEFVFIMFHTSDWSELGTVTMQFNKGMIQADQRLEELSEEHGISVTTLTEIMDNDHMTDIDALEELLETKFIIHMNKLETRSEEKIVGEHFAEEDGTMNYLDERNLINFFDFEDYGRNLLFDYTMFVDTESSDTWQIVLIPNY